MSTINSITETLLALDEKGLMDHVQRGLDDGLSASSILTDGLIAAMDIIGGRMEKGTIFLPEVLKAAKIMKSTVEILKPHLGDAGVSATGTVVIGTVKGDLHDIGKNLVKLLLESAGFEVFDLGIDVPPDAFVKAVKKHKATLLALSALLTTTMPMMQETIEAVNGNGLRERIKIMVGGAPVTQGFADKIGADGYASEAGSATRLAKQLCAS